MLCKIADLFVDVPEAGGLTPRYGEYLWDGIPDTEVIKLSEAHPNTENWPDEVYDSLRFNYPGSQFFTCLLDYNGMMLHSAAIGWKGRAYLFSAPSGTGKSTHTRMWQELYGEDSVVPINDDRPPLRFVDGRWYAYGAPWSGNANINNNVKFPLGGICFLQRGPENKIRRATPLEAISYLAGQTIHQCMDERLAQILLRNLDSLIKNIPMFVLECTPTTDAAKLSSETMSKAADEAGL